MLEKLKKISKIELSTKYSKLYILLLSFLLPVTIMLLVCKAQNMTPFNDTAFLIVDMFGQYSDYLAYFTSILSGSNNLFYTFNTALGADIWGLFTYYLASPVNLIALLFSAKDLTIGIAWIIIVKIGLCGLTFNYLLTRNGKSDFMSLIFSTAYALCAYVINYCYNIMWLDGVILLPIIVLGINYIIENNKFMVYLVSLALALFINYYIGFMLCIFSGIYFIYKFFLTVNNNEKFKLYWKRILTFAFASIVAVGLAAVVLLPNFGSIQSGRGSFDFSVLTFDANYTVADTVSKLFTHSFDNEQIKNNGFPQIYCGILTVFLVILYFFNKKISFREKCASATVLGIFIVSFHLRAFNLIWHGLNTPAWFYYRYSFMFCFVLLLLAYRSFKNLSFNSVSRNDFLKTIAIIVISAIFIEKQKYSFLTAQWLYIDCLLTLIYAIVFHLYIKFTNMVTDKNISQTKRKNISNNILLISFIVLYLACMDLWLNTNYTLNDLKNGSASQYSQDIENTSSIIDKISANDSGLYRTEKTFSRSTNDALQFGYYGISYSSSTYNNSANEFLQRLGFKKNHVWVTYGTGSTTAVDSLLGVKYVVTSNSEDFYKNYEFQFEDKNSFVYKNPYALSWGYMVSEDIFTTPMANSNTFDLQNNILKGLTGLPDEVYTSAIKPTITSGNVSISNNDTNTTYTKLNSSEEAWFEYSIPVTSTDNLYTYFNALNTEKVDVYINDELFITAFDSYYSDFIDLGTYELGDTVKLKFVLKEPKVSITDIYFYYENLEAFEKHYNVLAMNQANVTLNSSSSLTANINVVDEDKVLLLTVPYDKGWKIFVDGTETYNRQVFNSLIGINLSKGEHSITIEYTPNNFTKGLFISLSALLVLLVSRLIIIIYNKNKK